MTSAATAQRPGRTRARAARAKTTTWTRTHSAALLVLVVALGAVGVLVPWASGSSAGDGRLAAWLGELGLMLCFGLVVGHGVTGLWRGILVDDRNKLSSARLQLALWTGLLLSGYLEAVLANVGLHQVRPLAVSVPPALWAAMGVSATSLAASPFALGQKKKAGKLASTLSAADSRWRDVVTDEEEGLENVVDLGKLQMLLVTIVLVLAYGVVLGYSFEGDGPRIASLPVVNDAFAILLGISHAGYLAKKTAPRLGKAAPSS